MSGSYRHHSSDVPRVTTTPAARWIAILIILSVCIIVLVI